MPVNYSKWDNLGVSDDDSDENESHLDKLSCYTAYTLPKHHPLVSGKLNAEERKQHIDVISNLMERILDIESRLKDDMLEAKKRRELEKDLSEVKTRCAEVLNPEVKKENKYPDVCHSVTDSSRINKNATSFAEQMSLDQIETERQMKMLHECREQYMALCQLNGPNETVDFFLENPTLFNSRTVDILLRISMEQGLKKETDMLEKTLQQCMRIKFAIDTASAANMTKDRLSSFLVDVFKAYDLKWKSGFQPSIKKLRKIFLREDNSSGQPKCQQ